MAPPACWWPAAASSPTEFDSLKFRAMAPFGAIVISGNYYLCDIFVATRFSAFQNAVLNLCV
jgi:hypothetical protein